MRGARRDWARRGAAAVAGLALAATGLTALAPAAQAVEVVPRPASGTLSVSGHGFGHGRGMSQWGAYGAASKGLTYAQIMAFYYPGTTMPNALANSTITVRVTSDSDGATQVKDEDDLTATTGSRHVALPAWQSVTYWRVISSSAGYTLQYYTTADSAWHTYDVMGDGSTPTSPITISATDGTVRLHLPAGYDREYIGSVTGARYSGVHYSVVSTPMETYLRGVVPNEMPASWATEALRAQAVAARTYAADQRATSPSSRPYETCDSTACQVFDGYADYSTSGELIAHHTDSRSDAAVKATVLDRKGFVVEYHGALALTEFSASNGGWTTAGSLPYQVAKPDPYDGAIPNSANSWNDSVSVSTIENANPSIGRLVSLDVTRDGNGEWGGRVDSVTLVGTSGRVTVSGTTFASQAGFLHRWWQQRYVPLARDLTSDGRADITGRVTSTDQLRTYVGDGSGGFSGSVKIGTGWGVMSTVESAGDFDGDGKVDVLAVEKATGDLWLYPGDGTGHVTGRRLVGTGWNALRLVTSVGDFSGDGLPDIMAIDTSGRLRLYRGRGDGTVRGFVTAGTGWQIFDALVGMGDVNGDGHADLVARRRSTTALAFYLGNGKGRFLPGRTDYGNGWDAFQTMASPGDITGDGHPDLLAVDRATGVLWLYPGSGTSTLPRRSLGTGWKTVADLG